jgi:hypothetical protein
MPGSVTNIGGNAFYACVSLTNVYFTGNAPTADSSIFGGYEVCQPVPVTVYYLPGTTGWSNTFAGVPALLWNPLIQTGHGSFGVRDNQFGFNIGSLHQSGQPRLGSANDQHPHPRPFPFQRTGAGEHLWTFLWPWFALKSRCQRVRISALPQPPLHSAFRILHLHLARS